MPKDASGPARNIDPLLLPFLGKQGEAEELLARLISETAEPVIRGAICQKLRVSLNSSDGSMLNQDALDLASAVLALVISELRHLKMNPAQRAIGDFRQYVAVKAYSACAKTSKVKRPKDQRLGLGPSQKPKY